MSFDTMEAMPLNIVNEVHSCSHKVHQNNVH